MAQLHLHRLLIIIYVLDRTLGMERMMDARVVMITVWLPCVYLVHIVTVYTIDYKHRYLLWLTTLVTS